MKFEIKIIEFLQAGRNQFFDVFFQSVSVIGSILGFVATCILLFCFRKKLCFWYLFSYGCVFTFVRCLKEWVARIRPFNNSATIVAIGDMVTDYSFPSGHAACATAIAIFVCYLLCSHYTFKWQRACIITSGCVFVGLVCLSRMYLGMHYLTDVLAGVAISAIFCVLGILLMRYLEKGKRVKNENKNER